MVLTFSAGSGSTIAERPVIQGLVQKFMLKGILTVRARGWQIACFSPENLVKPALCFLRILCLKMNTSGKPAWSCRRLLRNVF
jgi:hypothetical protein